MRFQKFQVVNSIGDRGSTLENRLLQYFIANELVWALVNMLFCFILRMPFATTICYAGVLFGTGAYFTLSHILKKDPYFRQFYYVLLMIQFPLLWYFAGGSRSSASILFVCQLTVFVMCLRGTAQKIFTLMSLISAGMIQGVSRQLANPVYPMTDRQYAQGGAVLGLSTCLLIASVLIRQKREYKKELDSALESEKALEQSNSLQKNFLANMSHEIRSPMGIVLGFNNLILDCYDLDQIHEYAKDIKEAGATLLAVINDILDYSKIESGKLDIIESDYSFQGFIKEITRDVRLQCQAKGLELVTTVDEKVPNYLYGDVIRIKQCVLNLLSNSVKYTERGKIELAVCLEEPFEEGLYHLCFRVTDTGKGIAQEAIPNLFTAFQRLDEGANRGIEGTGLGLAITRNLVDEMNGTIEVESELGVGTSFYIRLSQKEGKQREEIAEVAEDGSLRGAKILVVDDVELNLVLVRKLLEKEQADITTINNGPDCLKEAEINRYDLIFLDHMMPEMNGVEVFQRLRESHGPNATTPVIMLTANAMAGASQEYLRMGFDGYISKPIAPNELKEAALRFADRV